MSIDQKYISNSLLNSIVKQDYEDDIKIISTETSNVVPVGENFTCQLIRIVINFSTNHGKNRKSISVIAKLLVESEYVKQIDEETDLYNRELSVYSNIFPKMQAHEYKKKVAPKLYFLCNNAKRMMIMEDLSVHYKMADRLEGLDLKHCLLAIEKLSYFHASSLKIYETNPEMKDQYTNDVFCKVQSCEAFDAAAIEGLIKTCQREPSLQKYSGKIKQDLADQVYKAGKYDPNFSVLNHGDFWCNNMMFRYKADGSAEDVLFVDFQMPVFASPFVDLHYFLATSTSLEVKKKHFHTILDHYYNTLSKDLKKLKVKTIIPSREDFDKSFRDKACLGLGASCCVLPLMKATQQENASLTDFAQSDEEGSFRHHCFTNPNYVQDLQFLLPFYEGLGLFE